MSLLIVDHFQSAVHSLKSTKTRTLLTTLGIAIGVASIVIVLSLSSGMIKVISGQVDQLDGNIAVIRPGTGQQTTDFTNPLATTSYGTSTLTEDDVRRAQAVKGVDAVAPIMLIESAFHADDKTLGGTIIATTPALEKTNQLPVRDGQFIDSVTNKNTAVIGAQLSVDLFGTDQSIGKVFTVRGQQFTVIGILKHLNNPVNFSGVDFDKAAIISLESGKGFHQGIAQLQQINVRAKDTASLTGVTTSIETELIKNHEGEKDFTIVSGEEIARPTSQLFTALTGVMTAIAAISLVVGGIGIMNIMLVNVAERTREVGLRKAVGASNIHIASQFLIESLIICLLGGSIGYIGGYILAFGISTFLTFHPAFTWQIAAAAAGVSVVVGVVFGIYPALRAARKHPIEALRHYQ